VRENAAIKGEVSVAASQAVCRGKFTGSSLEVKPDRMGLHVVIRGLYEITGLQKV